MPCRSRGPADFEAAKKRNKVKNVNNTHTLTILDPARGSGSFLVRAHNYLLKWYPEQYTKEQGGVKSIREGKIYQVRSDTYRLSVSVKQEILRRHIFGVNIDRQALHNTILPSLSVKNKAKDPLPDKQSEKF